MCSVTIQTGIDAAKLGLAIRETVIVAAEAQAEAIRKLHGDRAALAAKFGIRYEEHPGAAQGSLFGDEPVATEPAMEYAVVDYARGGRKIGPTFPSRDAASRYMTGMYDPKDPKRYRVERWFGGDL